MSTSLLLPLVCHSQCQFKLTLDILSLSSHIKQHSWAELYRIFNTCLMGDFDHSRSDL